MTARTPPSVRQRGLYPASHKNASTARLLSPAPTSVQPAFFKGPPGSGHGPRPSFSSNTSQISYKYSLSPDPSNWGADVSPQSVDPDDYLHNPDARRDRKYDRGSNIFTSRGLGNLGCLILLGTGILALFAGYPIISSFTRHKLSDHGGFNLGGINGTGQVPLMPGNWALVDLETPKSAYTTTSYGDGTEWQLIFSDEFNTDGRTFYPGDDPYWEAVDLHYWATGNQEWYDPAAITTRNGALEITLSRKETHDLHFQGGMMATWNKFCFTGGMVEVAVTLPGTSDVAGLWPAVWLMGNLGRAGYGATLDGLWPYSYDECNVGAAPNQTQNGLPIAATINGDRGHGGVLSYLPGQRLSRCTCPGESHPGPIHSDGSYVGRSAPEIDIFEAQIRQGPDGPFGQVSQSAQWAPFNAGYNWLNTSANLIIADPTISQSNSYKGSVNQQATSIVTKTNQNCYEKSGTGCFSVYGVEYKPGFDDAYISWISDNKLAWTVKAGGLAADTAVEISARPISQEPMYLLMNLGQSSNFGFVDSAHIPYPVTMRVDYIRVYQPKNAINYGCSPTDFPTADYINQYQEAYTNPNLTTWRDDFKQPIPKASFNGGC